MQTLPHPGLREFLSQMRKPPCVQKFFLCHRSYLAGEKKEAGRLVFSYEQTDLENR